MMFPRTERLSPPAEGPGATSGLRELVARHRVYWDVWPECLIDEGGQLVKVGFQLSLFGTHDDHPRAAPQPGCSECARVFAALQRVARSILPTEVRDSLYEVRPFDRALIYSPGGQRRDILLTIKILHRTGFDQPIDECEILCLKEMEGKLAELGAQRGSWKERSPAGAGAGSWFG